MNKAIIAGVAAGVLVVGLVFSPLFNGNPLSTAQAAIDTGVTRHYTLIASEKVVQVAPDNALHPGGIMYNAMVFNGTIPGPLLTTNQGDKVEITLKNEGKVIHSVDFHAAVGPGQVLSGNVAPGESKTWTFSTLNAGAWFYHCGADSLNGVWEHIANGMYGGVVVHAQKEKPAKEFYVVFSEIYNNADKGVFTGSQNKTGSFDVGKFLSYNPDLILTNGMAHKYVPSVGKAVKLPLNPDAKVFKVKPGEPTRWYIFAAGPNEGVAFHFIAGQMDLRDGSVRGWNMAPEKNIQTWFVPPGSGSVFESVFPEEGIYVGVDHNMANVVKGGAFAVQATNNSTANDQPEGTAVPSKAMLSQSGASPSTTTGSAAGNMTSTTPTNATATTQSNATSTSSNSTSTSGNSTSAGNSTSTGNHTASG